MILVEWLKITCIPKVELPKPELPGRGRDVNVIISRQYGDPMPGGSFDFHNDEIVS